MGSCVELLPKSLTVLFVWAGDTWFFCFFGVPRCLAENHYFLQVIPWNWHSETDIPSGNTHGRKSFWHSIWHAIWHLFWPLSSMSSDILAFYLVYRRFLTWCPAGNRTWSAVRVRHLQEPSQLTGFFFNQEKKNMLIFSTRHVYKHRKTIWKIVWYSPLFTEMARITMFGR